MEKKYVIRKNAFHYSDDHLYFHVTGVVVGDIYDDYTEANNDLLELEKNAYLSADLGDIEPFSGCSSNVDMGKMVQLKHHFEEKLGVKNILIQDKYGRIKAERGTQLPKDITAEQIGRIRYMSGLKFYELFTFEGEPQFYGIWKKKPFYRTEGFSKAEESAYFFNSYIDAFNRAIKHFPYDLEKAEVKGSMEEITDMPIILRSMIASSKSITYNEEEKKLTFNNLMDKDWASLCTLLKEKPFEIRILTFEDVKNFEQWNYESM